MYNEGLRREGFTNPERNYDNEPEKDLAMAVCSLAFGIAGILTGLFGLGFDIAALVMGIVVLRRRYYGRGFAIAGIATSAVGFVSTVVLTVLICTAAGDLKDDLISTITDYLYYYSEGGLMDDYGYDDEEYDLDYDPDEYYEDEETGDEYYDEEEPVEEEYDETDESYYEDDQDVSRSIGAGADTFDDTDTIEAADVFGDQSYSDIFSYDDSDAEYEEDTGIGDEDEPEDTGDTESEE